MIRDFLGRRLIPGGALSCSFAPLICTIKIFLDV